MLTSEELHQAATTYAILFELPFFQLFRIYGKDAPRYLQGRLTQEIKSLIPGTGARTLLLTPNGKIQGQLSVLRRVEDFVLVSDPLKTKEAVSHFLESLLQFKVADQVEVEQMSLWKIVSLQGPNSSSLLKKMGVDHLGTTAYHHHETTVDGIQLHVIANPRGASAGFDLIIEKDNYERLKTQFRQERVDNLLHEGNEDTRTMLRICSGIPEFPSDIHEKVSAPDIDLSTLVSFTKGCYVGQEVVEMSCGRGRPNRKLVLLEGQGDSSFAPGTAISEEALGDSLVQQPSTRKPCGIITSSCAFPSKNMVLALAFLKFTVKDDASLFASNVPLRRCTPGKG